jgi:D-sedoheptulose 7-phosphate isomerase
MDNGTKIKDILHSSADLKNQIAQDTDFIQLVNSAASAITKCLSSGNKLLLCGNGGSAADAQHLAAEFSGRFYFDRDPLFAEALHVNTSYLTAVGNDYSYDEIYARLIKAKGRKGDVLIGISTSGNSGNVLKALERAKEIGMINIGLTGNEGGKMKELCDILLNIPSNDTPRIQECHITVGHIICELVEEQIFTK